MWEARLFDAPAATAETCKQRADSRGDRAENTCPILTQHTCAAPLTGSDSAQVCASQGARRLPLPPPSRKVFTLSPLTNPWLFHCSPINADHTDHYYYYYCCSCNHSFRRITINIFCWNSLFYVSFAEYCNDNNFSNTIGHHFSYLCAFCSCVCIMTVNYRYRPEANC